MGNLIRGWQKDEFNAPSAIWKTALDTKCKITYLYIVNCLENGDDCPPHSQIAKACSFSKRTSEKATKILHEYGLIRKINRKKPGKNENDSNRYIVFHPKQVKGLPWIEDPEGSESNSPHVANNVRQGSESNSHLCPSVCSSVRLYDNNPSNQPSDNDTPSHQLRDYWRKAFNEELSDLEIEEILSYNLPINKVTEIIRKVRLYIDIRTNPFNVVARAVADAATGNEWVWNENNERQHPNKRRRTGNRHNRHKPESKSGNSDLPRVLQQPEEENIPETDPQVKKEIMDELRRMRERSNKPSPEKIEQRIKELKKLKKEEEEKVMPNQTKISSYINTIEDLEKQLKALREQEGKEVEVGV